MDADGEIAFDTTVSDFIPGIIRFYGGEEQGVVAMPDTAVDRIDAAILALFAAEPRVGVDVARVLAL